MPQAPTGAVDTLIAAAGSGKTYNLVLALAGALAHDVSPERILGTTFTRRAAAALIERARARLIGEGDLDGASGLLSARMGTVNGVSGSLVADYALDLGRSPRTEVLDESREAGAFRVAAQAVIAAHAHSLSLLADRFAVEDWQDDLRRMVQLARANGVAPAALPGNAADSVAGLLALFPAPDQNGGVLDAALLEALQTARDAIPAIAYPQSLLAERDWILGVAETAGRGELPAWPDWAKLAKLKLGGKYAAVNDVVAAAAAPHLRHPALRADLTAYIRGMFECAAEAMAAYAGYKAERGLIDFTDQEALALGAVQPGPLRDLIAEQIGAVFVDEFQDSSPLQLALFAQLADMADHSVWVGDPKQAIYGFRGSDPQMALQASQRVAEETGGVSRPLTVSRRSRKGIVDFVNGAFTESFVAMGLPRQESRFQDAHRVDPEGLPPALNVWRMGGKFKPDRAAALAAGIAVAIADGEAWPVEEDGVWRPLRAGDIAVLCCSNDNAAAIAAALAARGLKVACQRDGLLEQPECQLVLAALRWASDRGDRLALAEMARLFAEDGHASDWLEGVFTVDPEVALREQVAACDALDRLRDRLLAVSPSGALAEVLALPVLHDRILTWPDPVARVDNLEALRRLAGAFEAEQASRGTPATVPGLNSWIAGQDAKQPRSAGGDAVEVLTYHGGKGLEWPLVILTDLDDTPKSRLFGLQVESRGELDWRDPLAGRRIRFWPWPYGAQKARTGLDELAEASDCGIAAARREHEERIRLLYVGVTRAKDHLVLAIGRGAFWLDSLVRADGSPAIRLDGDSLFADEVQQAARFLDLSPDAEGGAAAEVAPVVYLAQPAVAASATPLRWRPSEALDDAAWRIAETVSLGARLPLVGTPDMARLGEALHAIIGCDDPGRDMAWRHARARAIFDRWGVAALTVESALEGSSRLQTFVQARWPDGDLRREVPLSTLVADRMVTGRIDALVQTDAGFTVIDHKSYPGNEAQQAVRVLGYAAQLQLYATGVERVIEHPCLGLWVHLPISGVMHRLELIPE